MFSLKMGFIRSQTISLTTSTVISCNYKFSIRKYSTERAKEIAKHIFIKTDKSQLDFSSKSYLEKRALALIFGDRPYSKFSKKEKELADAYQNFIEREDGIALPNTWRSEENEQIKRLFGETIFNQNLNGCNSE